jgi:hypothetical protein
MNAFYPIFEVYREMEVDFWRLFILAGKIRPPRACARNLSGKDFVSLATPCITQYKEGMKMLKSYPEASAELDSIVSRLQSRDSPERVLASSDSDSPVIATVKQVFSFYIVPDFKPNGPISLNPPPVALQAFNFDTATFIFNDLDHPELAKGAFNIRLAFLDAYSSQQNNTKSASMPISGGAALVRQYLLDLGSSKTALASLTSESIKTINAAIEKSKILLRGPGSGDANASQPNREFEQLTLAANRAYLTFLSQTWNENPLALESALAPIISQVRAAVNVITTNASQPDFAAKYLQISSPLSNLLSKAQEPNIKIISKANSSEKLPAPEGASLSEAFLSSQFNSASLLERNQRIKSLQNGEPQAAIETLNIYFPILLSFNSKVKTDTATAVEISGRYEPRRSVTK